MKLSEVIHVVHENGRHVTIYSRGMEKHITIPVSKFDKPIDKNYNPRLYEIRTTTYGYTFIKSVWDYRCSSAMTSNLDTVLANYIQIQIIREYIPLTEEATKRVAVEYINNTLDIRTDVLRSIGLPLEAAREVAIKSFAASLFK